MPNVPYPRIIRKSYSDLFFLNKIFYDDKYFAYYSPLKNEIVISKHIPNNLYEKVLNHELNHWKQQPLVSYSYVLKVFVLVPSLMFLMLISVLTQNILYIFITILFPFFCVLYVVIEDYFVHKNNPPTEELDKLRKSEKDDEKQKK
ncbi:hypothetical protein ES703_61530 [subsurface metagenome]